MYVWACILLGTAVYSYSIGVQYYTVIFLPPPPTTAIGLVGSISVKSTPISLQLISSNSTCYTAQLQSLDLLEHSAGQLRIGHCGARACMSMA